MGHNGKSSLYRSKGGKCGYLSSFKETIRARKLVKAQTYREFQGEQVC